MVLHVYLAMCLYRMDDLAGSRDALTAAPLAVRHETVAANLQACIALRLSSPGEAALQLQVTSHAIERA